MVIVAYWTILTGDCCCFFNLRWFVIRTEGVGVLKVEELIDTISTGAIFFLHADFDQAAKF